MSVLIGAGLLAFELLPMLSAEGRASRWAVWSDPAKAASPLFFMACAVGVMIVKRKPVLLGLLFIMIVPYALGVIATLPQ
jgi:hypothetical protein